jgi:hypothetical protein
MHAFLMVSCWINTSDRFKNKIAQYFLTILGFLWYLYDILRIALNNYMTAPPDSSEFNIPTACVITWNRIELFAWFGIVCSNILFMFL